MKINWGNKLVITMIIFAGIMATMVTIAMRENIDLVDTNYYKKELAYEEQIEKMRNTKKDNAIEVAFDKESELIIMKFKEEIQVGEIHLFRPSDAKKDIKIRLSSDNNIQKIPTSGLQSGLWRIKVSWEQKGDSYFYEQQINLP